MADHSKTGKHTPLRQMPVVFLDVETTGLDPKVHEIVEIAAVALDGSVLLDTKVKPQNLAVATEEALRVNGYNEADWADAPTFDEIQDEVVAALRHRVVIGQNPNFDRSFVVEALRRAGDDEPERRVKRHVIDTITLAWEHLVPCGLEKLNLGSECEFLGIELDRDKRHGALADAQAARTLYLMTLRATEEQRFAWRDRARRIGLVETEGGAPGDAAP